MSNKRYEDGFYNEQVKERYLLTLANEQTRKTYKRIFLRSKDFEEYYEKDLYEFNLEEIKEVLKALRPQKIYPSRQNGYIIHSYIDWAIREGYRSNNINPLDAVDMDWYYQFIDESKETLFHEDKINEVIKNCVNAQDAVIIKLLFEGVMGESYTEIRNLKKQDVNFETRMLRLVNEDGSERYLRVSEECIELIKKAIAQTEYVKRNGQVKEGSKNKYSNLVENDYVVRISATNNKTTEEKADNHLILRRLAIIKDVMGIPYLTATNIRNSGMLKMANDLYQERGKLDKEELIEICEVFNTGKIIKDGVEEYNYYPYYRDFLNLETVKKIYG